MLTAVDQWLRENLDLIVIFLVVYSAMATRERRALADSIERTNERIDDVPTKIKQLDPLVRELDRLQYDLAALRCLLFGQVSLLLQAGPESAAEPRFEKICTEADAICPDEETRTALRRVIQWEGDKPVGWFRRPGW
jgi:hypothetical protein